MPLTFGVFDHLDASGRPLVEFFENRLRLVEHYDRLGFHAYHTAEHHATPLGMAPSPSLLHAAIAQRTQRLRFGPLVYTLNLYHPLRLAEEICMLDHMSRGRLVVGVGRGISPIELRFYGADPELGQPMYVEAYEVIKKALTQDTLDHDGRFYKFSGVPIVLHPLQRPHPPIWYGIGNPESVEWCVGERVNIVTNAPRDIVHAITSRFRKAWAEHGQGPMPFMGTTRHMVVAPTDAEAIDIARRAYKGWYESFIWLWKKHGAKPRFALYTEDFDGLLASGQAIAGSPATVRDTLRRQVDEFGMSYLLCRFAFGDMAYEESLRSAELFAREVMPEFVVP